MDKDTRTIADEIGQGGDAEEMKVIAALASGTEGLDTAKKQSIRTAILAGAEANRSPKNHMRWNPFMYLLPVGALSALVILIATQGGPLMPGDVSGDGAKRLAVAEKEGFGELPALMANLAGATPVQEATNLSAGTMPAREVAILAPDSPVTSDAAFAPDAPLAASAGLATKTVSSAPAIGMGGGSVAGMPAPMPVRCLGCDVELRPRTVYRFEGAMPSVPSEVAVYRTRKTEYPSDTVKRVLEPLGLSGFGKLALQNVSFTEDGDGGMSWSYDANSNYLYFNSNGQYRILEANADSSRKSATIADDEAIRLASSFLASRGISTAGYGAPRVDRPDYGYPCSGTMPCPMMKETSAVAPATDATLGTPEAISARPAIYPPYWNASVTVSYAAMRDGTPVLNWDGSDLLGIALTLDGTTGEVTNGNIMLTGSAERSLYPARGSDEILADAMRGGLSPYYYYGDSGSGLYTPEEERRRPTVTVTLSSARLGYVERYSDDGRSRYLLPVVGFRGTIKDQYGNVSDWGTIVPVVAGSGADGTVSGGAAPTMPVALPEKSVPR